MDIPIIDLGEEELLPISRGSDDKKQINSFTLLCNACLCMRRALHEITDEKMARFYLDTLREIPLCNIPMICPSLCWQCKASLRKAAIFKEQVKDSYRILQTYTNENLHEYIFSDTERSIFQVHSLPHISIAPDTQNLDEIEEADCDSSFLKRELKLEWSGGGGSRTSLKLENGEEKKEKGEELALDDRELKIEWNGKDLTEDSILLDDGPLSDCNAQELDVDLSTFTEKKKKRKSKVKSKTRRAEKVIKRLRNSVKNPKRQKTNQKILTLELSYEEMLVEREKEATKETYLKAPYKCESCLVGFNYRRSYKAHNAAKHTSELGNYICPICKTIISSVESFTSHYKRHMRRYECGICKKRTMDIKVMQQHYYSTHEISLKEYKCDLCGKISNSIDTHRYHKDTHKARVQCAECDKTFSHRAGLLNHRLSVHELHNAFPCTVCDKVFRWKTSLKRHLEKHQLKEGSGPAAAYCVECGVTFSSSSSYQRHMKNSLKHVSQEQLRFICDDCGRRFADKTKLRDHIEEKHLHRTYQCHLCLKPSKNRVALDQHVRNVHKGRPHNKICHYCGKGFPTKMQLESHLRTHTGERPFICEYCPTTFSQQSNLYKHNRQVHLNIKSKRYPMCKKRKEEPLVGDPPPPADPYRPLAALRYSPERGLVI